MLRLFETMALPVALYNSEVWGTLFFSQNPNNMDFFDIPKLGVANLQFKFLRYILGVNKRSSKWSLLSESGCFPISCKVIISMVKFWYHLSTSESPILKAALKINSELCAKGYKSWFFTLTRILKFLDIENITLSNQEEISKIINKIKSTVNSKYQHAWKNELMTHRSKEGKLNFFSKIIKNHTLQDYLKDPSLPFKFRKAITNFRIGNHRLPVEVGRYYGRVERAERLCPLCSNDIGDEWHYLLYCNNTIIKSNRDQVFHEIDHFEPGFLKRMSPIK